MTGWLSPRLRSVSPSLIYPRATPGRRASRQFCPCLHNALNIERGRYASSHSCQRDSGTSLAVTWGTLDVVSPLSSVVRWARGHGSGFKGDQVHCKPKLWTDLSLSLVNVSGTDEFDSPSRQSSLT
ncbi:hypothetical protein RRG08_031580 [Elysia crispata]|uniref:Uncharacterized protein n=1 Tax=Elysia crispata TaxID=231223 RepID=A0AAE1B4Q8_9GAST|nr:hypothetical protein RRG08_031580 [Elysia crispata]